MVDVATSTLEFGGRRVTFPIDKFSRYCLMNGVDELGYLLAQGEAITAHERAREAR